jgi:glycosyltransferase involved in cell wall biosynthesis
MWLPYHHRLAQLAAKQSIARVVSTRGNLEPWAMTHKQWKKSLAWQLYQRRDLMRAWRHHTTAETEARNVQRLGLGVPILVIPNGVDIPSRLPDVTGMEKARQTRPRTVLFLGRISPKKGLPMLIEAWARVRPRGWVLRIAGPDEMGHWAEIENAIVTAGLGEVVSFIGPVHGRMKQCAFFEADLFVLPTHSENFGMAVAEALAHGLPILTTTGAPWSMLPERGCGWWVDASVDGIVEGLQQATSCDPEMLQAMGAKGREFVKAEFGWARVAKQFIAAYQELLAGGRAC